VTVILVLGERGPYVSGPISPPAWSRIPGAPFAALAATALSSYALTALSFSSFQSAFALLNKLRPIALTRNDILSAVKSSGGGDCGWDSEGFGGCPWASVRVGGGRAVRSLRYLCRHFCEVHTQADVGIV
jgi:hypothetical protein